MNKVIFIIALLAFQMSFAKVEDFNSMINDSAQTRDAIHADFSKSVRGDVRVKPSYEAKAIRVETGSESVVVSSKFPEHEKTIKAKSADGMKYIEQELGEPVAVEIPW